MLKYFIALLSICNCVPCFSQNNPKVYETDFAWHIKQIDEFIERFNSDDKTLIKVYDRKFNPQGALTRDRLLKSLFNAEGKDWDISDIKRFINVIDNKKKPVFLHFFDKDWCAKLDCMVTWKGRPQNAELTLRIEKFPDGSSKWVINGVEAKFLTHQRLVDSIADRPLSFIPTAKNHTTSLHPFSHATRFMNIDLVSRDKENIENYFLVPARMADNDDLLTFMYEIINNRLVINRAVSLTYKFYQVKGWAFEVSEYNRQTRNSGWLISKLTRL